MNGRADDTHTDSDGLWRWLLGGLIGGGVILGLLIAAYANNMKGNRPTMKRRTDDTHTDSDGLWRWLLGGLLGGGVILGLLIAAYAIGFNRGGGSDTASRAATQASAPTTAAAAKPSSGALGPVTVTPALVAQGATLYKADGCAGCHSLTGASGAGPTFKDLAGGKSTMTNGQEVTVDDAYLQRAIADPDAEIVKGYRAGLMSAAIAGFDLSSKPDDIRALVAFIKSQK